MKQKKRARTPVGYLVFVFLLYVLLGGAAGYLMAWAADGRGTLFWVGSLVLLLAAYLLQILLHETGHLLFGLATGYRFASFRVGSLIWVKTDQGIRRGKYHLPGTAGQCLLFPPDPVEGNYPLFLYNLGGSLMNLIVALVFGGLSLLFAQASFGWLLCWLMVITGLVGALQNGIPISSGVVANDGYNAFALRKHPAARRAFWLQLAINGELTRGKRLREMPQDWFTLPTEAEMGDPLTAAIAALACNRLMDQHQLDQAARTMEAYLAGDNALLDLHRFLMTCDLVSCRLLAGAGPEALRPLDTPGYQKLAKGMKAYPAVLRTQYIRALLAEENPEKGAAILDTFASVTRTYPYPGEIAGERELMALAQTKKEELL